MLDAVSQSDSRKNIFLFAVNPVKTKDKDLCELETPRVETCHFVLECTSENNFVSFAREIEILCEDCKLAAPLAIFRSFGPRFRVH